MSALILQFRAMPRTQEPLPNRIREWRERAGLTQAQLADKIGTTYATVGRFETGARELTVEWLRLIARVFDIQIGQLLLPEDLGLSPEEQKLIKAARNGHPAAVQGLLGAADAALAFAADDAAVRDGARRTV